mmetsp:Transcript_7455/g.26235  ORF Transcript_7455/g.26235 Transcript_7455/m.26235 type:complete len:229 (-) Transcript_7455:219-905(-)
MSSFHWSTARLLTTSAAYRSFISLVMRPLGWPRSWQNSCTDDTAASSAAPPDLRSAAPDAAALSSGACAPMASSSLSHSSLLLSGTAAESTLAYTSRTSAGEPRSASGTLSATQDAGAAAPPASASPAGSGSVYLNTSLSTKKPTSCGHRKKVCTKCLCGLTPSRCCSTPVTCTSTPPCRPYCASTELILLLRSSCPRAITLLWMARWPAAVSGSWPGPLSVSVLASL